MEFRKFDVFPKLDNEYRIGTTIGGLLSMLSIIMTIFLSYSEISSFIHPPIRQRLIVDTHRPTNSDGKTISADSQSKLDIFLNISFPDVPCYLMHFDVIDPVTQLSIPLEEVHSQFYRLKKDGSNIGPFDSVSFYQTPSSDQCGDCFINTTEGHCCNTCQEVIRVHQQKESAPPSLINTPQCSAVVDKMNSMENEGCRITSGFKSIRVASEFHVSPGYSWNSLGWHVHTLKIFGKNFSDLNLSHTIHTIHFTKTEKKMPLDDFSSVQTEKKSWRVVYTTDLLDFNYSASNYEMYDPKSYSPGVIFKYDVSPISAITYYDREPFLHLCTRLLTVIGGILGLFRLLDTVLFYGLQKKNTEQIE